MKEAKGGEGRKKRVKRKEKRLENEEGTDRR